MSREYRIELPDDAAARLSTLAGIGDTTPEALLSAAATGLLARAADLNAWIVVGEGDLAQGRVRPFGDAISELDGIIERAKAARG
ncbi:MAG: hypothetical protein JWO26_2065 [Rhodospirillales bacterium]|jgi:predicted transcriptional regulator|nr:hypothetical protein [Rhodospirillales bacterium]MDB5382433.1 hypothetical protein [Rhodospirillales bacterium]